MWLALYFCWPMLMETKSLVSEVAFSNPAELECKYILTEGNMTMWIKLTTKWLILWWVTFCIPFILESFCKSKHLLNNFLKGKCERGTFWEMSCTLVINWTLEETEKNHPLRAFWRLWISLEGSHRWEDRVRSPSGISTSL